MNASISAEFSIATILLWSILKCTDSEHVAILTNTKIFKLLIDSVYCTQIELDSLGIAECINLFGIDEFTR